MILQSFRADTFLQVLVWLFSLNKFICFKKKTGQQFLYKISLRVPNTNLLIYRNYWISDRLQLRSPLKWQCYSIIYIIKPFIIISWAAAKVLIVASSTAKTKKIILPVQINLLLYVTLYRLEMRQTYGHEPQ